MIANVLRGAEVSPSLRRVIGPGFGAYAEGEIAARHELDVATPA